MPKWDLTPDEALAQLQRWEHTTLVMHARIMDDRAGLYTREGDVYLFAMATRQVLRFARLVRAVAPQASWSAIDNAINAFDTEVPDVKAVRDVLDHLDEYLRGVGTGFPAGPPEAHQYELLQVLRPALMWHEHTTQTHRLRIMPAPGEHIYLDVTRDAGAVARLGHAIRDALAAT